MTLSHLTPGQKVLRRKEYIREWKKAHPERVRQLKANWRLAHGQEPRNAQKMRARSLLRHYAREGVVKRGSCAVCGKPTGEAHHVNYGRPLDVIWLCGSHHAEIHDLIMQELRERFWREEDAVISLSDVIEREIESSLSNLIWST